MFGSERYNEKHSNFIIAITKSILITQISILYHFKGLETHIVGLISKPRIEQLFRK